MTARRPPHGAAQVRLHSLAAVGDAAKDAVGPRVVVPCVAARWARFRPWRSLVCPRGHHVSETSMPIGHLPTRCRNRPPGARGECGILLYILPLVELDAAFVAEITLDEAREMQRRRMAPLAALTYLGLTDVTGILLVDLLRQRAA